MGRSLDAPSIGAGRNSCGGSAGPRPRVTLGIATFNRSDYLEAAIRSGLDQDYEDLEVLLVLDGTTNPDSLAIVERLAGEPRLRVVRHATNRGIAAAFNSFVEHGRGELIAMVGDDDLCLPGRIRREVEIFDRDPETGVVHGDATVIDSDGKQLGRWNSAELAPAALVHNFFFSHNHIVDTTRMVHRRVYEQVGGYDDRFPIANDFEFWLRAAHEFRFRHCDGGPLTAVRRHGENASDERSGRAAELADVEAILRAALDRYPLRELVPELDWSVIDARAAECQALQKLAAGFEHRQLPLPALAAELRERAQRIAPTPRPPRLRHGPNRLLMTAFGFNDAGGGTTVPRLAAKELVRRGWEVTVFHAAVEPTAARLPYELSEAEQDGVRLIGVHNRPSALFDLGHPLRELHDPPITQAFAHVVEQFKPDVVHFHNLHNLGGALIGEATVRGVPSYFTTHNYWLICPRAYLLNADGQICAGPGDGQACAQCAGALEPTAYRRRLAELRAYAHGGLNRILAVSESVRETLLAAGYDPELIDVVRQAMPHDAEIWRQVGAHRRPGRRGERLTVAFVGSAYPHKGPQLLVAAAQATATPIRVKLIGEVRTEFATQLRELDHRGAVEFSGAFSPSEIGSLLADVDVAVLPSIWRDCAPLAAAECKAARVPLLVPRLGGLAEAIAPETDGLSFDGLSVEGLTAQLDRLAGEPGLLERLQAQIRPPASFGGYVDQLESYYRGERERPAGEAAPAGAAPCVRWQGEHGASSSLSIINDQITARLGLEVERVARNRRRIGSPAVSGARVEVHHQWPPDLDAPPAGALAAIVPWEFGSVPTEWIEQIDRHVDELWVPSEFVRAMYVADGVDPARVVTIPNGVDLERFAPVPAGAQRRDGPVRFLFVGGLIARKAPDLLLAAFKRAFPEREDVVLTVKDFGADGVYVTGQREPIRAHAASGALPRLELIDAELDVDQMVALYQGADVLVHPYRAEGFAMPVLEAMACGVPVIVTAGGPTDEFCPPEAGWRIDARRCPLPPGSLEGFETVGEPWMLEPDIDSLVALLREAAGATPEQRRARGAAGRAAAEQYSWERAAHSYAERIRLLAARPSKLYWPEPRPFPLSASGGRRVLATPAWRGHDDLAELLALWASYSDPESGDCLYLLADPACSGTPTQIEETVLEAAGRSGADLRRCADIEILMESLKASRDRSLLSSVDAYVPLHPACAGYRRLAKLTGTRVVTLAGDELRDLLSASPVAG